MICAGNAAMGVAATDEIKTGFAVARIASCVFGSWTLKSKEI